MKEQRYKCKKCGKDFYSEPLKINDDLFIFCNECLNKNILSKEQLKLFVDLRNDRHRGDFHKIQELEPRICKKKKSQYKGKIVYYEKGETEEDFFYTEEYILDKLKRNNLIK